MPKIGFSVLLFKGVHHVLIVHWHNINELINIVFM